MLCRFSLECLIVLHNYRVVKSNLPHEITNWSFPNRSGPIAGNTERDAFEVSGCRQLDPQGHLKDGNSAITFSSSTGAEAALPRSLSLRGACCAIQVSVRHTFFFSRRSVGIGGIEAPMLRV